jgi:hypothetical protein
MRIETDGHQGEAVILDDEYGETVGKAGQFSRLDREREQGDSKDEREKDAKHQDAKHTDSLQARLRVIGCGRLPSAVRRILYAAASLCKPDAGSRQTGALPPLDRHLPWGYVEIFTREAVAG